VIFIAEPYRQILHQLGSNPKMIFTEPAIKPWRRLPDRENCTWDITGDITGDIAGPTAAIRLHVKRFPAMGSASPARDEAEGYRLLQERGIPAAVVAAWGNLDDGRSFIAIEDLVGFTPADKLVESGLSFERVLGPTAELSAKLHNAGLHHRDLYLCHFLARVEKDQAAEIRVIDAARVRKLPGLLTRRRWIIKDEWLSRYCALTKSEKVESLKRSIQRKSDAIGAHDEKLRRRQPNRNISIPRS
jgi:hypothetical protein